jgi:hypothetical protein
MRITQDLLHKFARETVKMRKRSEPDLHAAYLTGSLLDNEPLLGGATDIDLVLIHKYRVPVERETEGITPEVSLDIVHKLKENFDQYRSLRQDPWMGYPLTNYQSLLFDTDHWLEFIQSSVAAEFQRPDNVLARVNRLLDTAREGWFTLMQTPSQTHLEWLLRYLEILALAANAVSGLIGPPLTTRRFLMTFSERVNNLGVPKALAGFYGLLGHSKDQDVKLREWINAFEADLTYLTETAVPPAHLASCRHAYYLNGIRAIAESNSPEQAVWPLLKNWTDVNLVAKQPTSGKEIWDLCLETLQLSEDNIDQKTEALDAYLDNTEIIIEAWADTYGI